MATITVHREPSVACLLCNEPVHGDYLEVEERGAVCRPCAECIAQIYEAEFSDHQGQHAAAEDAEHPVASNRAEEGQLGLNGRLDRPRLSPYYVRVLAEVGRGADCYGALMHRLGVKYSTITAVVSRLAKDGYLSKPRYGSKGFKVTEAGSLVLGPGPLEVAAESKQGKVEVTA
jgi:hypothetical protein